MVNRREFGKLCASVLAALAALAVLPKKDRLACPHQNGVGVPAKYRGFDISLIDKHGDLLRICATDKKNYVAMDFVNSDPETMWETFKPYLDKAIDRYERKIA